MTFLGIILTPFTIIYDLVTRLRNYLYDSGYKTSFEFDVNVIAVGNLSVGGTGKTPMIEYLLRLLNKEYRLTTLSRGYKRKTSGFRIANDQDTARTLGDEPFQIYNKFKSNVDVTVGEDRAIAIPFILAELPETNIILLDDAYQHRSVKPSLNILLTDYSKPFFKDHVLPGGRLREARKGAKRADYVVVTKCDGNIPDQIMLDYECQIKKYTNAPIAFSSIKYGEPICFMGDASFSENVFLISGIANHNTLENYVSKEFNLIGSRHFADHHEYTQKDILMVREEFNRISLDQKVIITTEKDMVRLLNFVDDDVVKQLSLFYLPIESYFVKGGKDFDEAVYKSIKD